MPNYDCSKHFFAGNGSTILEAPIISWKVHNLPAELKYLLDRPNLNKVSEPLLNHVYPHNMYEPRCYDGFLVSKAFIDSTIGIHKRNRKRLYHFFKLALREGVIALKHEKAIWRAYKGFKKKTIHNMCLAPRDLPIMGDCGAYSFVTAKEPPFSTEEVLDYYTKYEFTQGVSVDHLILDFVQDKKFRFDLTLSNAEVFIREHKKRKLPWIPIASLQGWNVKSYVKAAAACAKMGYTYMAVGSIVKSSTEYIMRILRSITDEFDRLGYNDIKLHLFGVTRFQALPDFASLGAYSFDSTSVYVASWLKDGTNYLTPTGWHSCIRLPVTSKKLRNMTEEELEDSPHQMDELRGISEKFLERILKVSLKNNGKVPKKLIEEIVDFNYACYPLDPKDRKTLIARVKEVILGRAWEKCPCRLCQTLGIHVLLLNGWDLTAARAFHNLWSFHCQIYPRIMNGEVFKFLSPVRKPIYMTPILDLEPE